MFHGLTHEALAALLAAIPPVDLLGVALLDECVPPALFPTTVDAERLAEATIELVAYNRQCQAARQRVAALPPIAVEAADEAFSL